MLRFRARPRQSVASEDGSIGSFGRVDHNKHYLYASYPCLAVYVKRIQNDFNYRQDIDLDPHWDLPEDIVPGEAAVGLPTINLLGYATSQVMSPAQIQWLRNAGFGPDFEFESEHDSIPYVGSLMNAVRQEIDCARIKSGELVISSEGSVGQSSLRYPAFRQYRVMKQDV